jgi:hypothetical protein
MLIVVLYINYYLVGHIVKACSPTTRKKSAKCQSLPTSMKGPPGAHVCISRHTNDVIVHSSLHGVCYME